ncbi:hypothetical protein V6O07_23625 [Arthrospira platensis SPKY2]
MNIIRKVEEITYPKYIEDKELCDNLFKLYNKRVLISGDNFLLDKEYWKEKLKKDLYFNKDIEVLILDSNINQIYKLNTISRYAWELSLIKRCTIYCTFLNEEVTREKCIELGILLSNFNNCKFIIGIKHTLIDIMEIKRILSIMNNLNLINTFIIVENINNMIEEILK